MFNEKDMSKALKTLFSLFEENDYEEYDEEEYGDCGGLCLKEVCQALRDEVQTVYEYQVTSTFDHGFDYRGKELFDQRAVCVYGHIDQYTSDIADTGYGTELWMLEDGSFVIVNFVSMKVGDKENHYDTEYRTVFAPLEEWDDLFFEPEDLIEQLQLACVPLWEMEATIYAM